MRGPILAGVITFTASQDFNAGRLAVALAYALGSAGVLYLLMIGGRRLVRPLARRGAALQVATGAVMVLVAVAMIAELDYRFQRDVVRDLPSALVNPAEGLERSKSAQQALSEIDGIEPHGVGALVREETPLHPADRKGSTGKPAGPAADLPVYGEAPEFADTERWFNTPGDRPLTMKGLRGRVVLIDFWTYSCVNCIRTLPYLNAWNERYAKDGLTIVGVHSPEFPFEREAGNVEAAIAREGIHYPVVQDNELGTWTAYGNQYWPAEYFVDARGRVRYAHFGEGDYGKKEEVIRELLAEAGDQVGAKRAGAHGLVASTGVTTPETYLGPFRAERFTNPELSPGSHDFDAPELRAPARVPPNEFAYRGKWKISLESATAEAGAGLDLDFGARRVYLVLGSPAGPRQVRVMLDGKLIAPSDAGADVHDGAVTVGSQRLYELVDLPRVEHHLLELELEAGVTGYAFTFG